MRLLHPLPCWAQLCITKGQIMMTRVLCDSVQLAIFSSILEDSPSMVFFMVLPPTPNYTIDVNTKK